MIFGLNEWNYNKRNGLKNIFNNYFFILNSYTQSWGMCSINVLSVQYAMALSNFSAWCLSQYFSTNQIRNRVNSNFYLLDSIFSLDCPFKHIDTFNSLSDYSIKDNELTRKLINDFTKFPQLQKKVSLSMTSFLKRHDFAEFYIIHSMQKSRLWVIWIG